jgi:hypothetical protein
MKRKLLLIASLMLLATAAFSKDMEVMWTSSGRQALVGCKYKGKNNGQFEADVEARMPGFIRATPDKDHFEIIHWALNKYNYTAGDTFYVYFSYFSMYAGGDYVAICEFTSARNYNYWFYQADIGMR